MKGSNSSLISLGIQDVNVVSLRMSMLFPMSSCSGAIQVRVAHNQDSMSKAPLWLAMWQRIDYKTQSIMLHTIHSIDSKACIEYLAVV